MLEYEETFPYDGELGTIKSTIAYTKDDIRKILEYAKNANLEVIPLVQTFGHLEWILKHEKFAKYREMPPYSQTICLSNFEAVDLVKNSIDQVMQFHNSTTDFFHIGADEAYQVVFIT